ncbi:YusW family protein [Exiguobacterium antarcticum]|uniref:YusW family protein n=1 Tax=Exiguobacterium antarcticum TaxID=132920 RepID=A0ABT6R5A2_9BACL|nr:YusW family protein [Exiguobacterium antarcticum]MDI3236138.1 YusW family protein [Exiguobacterium antarcticum]
MKKTYLVPVLGLALFAAGCGNSDNQETEKVEETTTTDDNSMNDDSTMKDDSSGTQDQDMVTENADKDYRFVSLSVEADTADMMDMVDISYDRDNDGTEADYKMDGERSQGNEAMKILDPKLDELNMDANTSNDDAIAEIEKVFDIKDATRLEVEIEFANGTEKEFMK